MKDQELRNILLEHLLSLTFVGTIFLVLIIMVYSEQKSGQTLADARLQPYLALDFIDYENPLHRALLRETLDVLEPGSRATHRQLIDDISQYRDAQISNLARGRNIREGLSGARIAALIGMYFKFFLVYLLVMLLTYYGVQTIAVLRFLLWKQNRSSFLAEAAGNIQEMLQSKENADRLRNLGKGLGSLMKAVLRGWLYFILFSPAYVIAYSMKTRFDTDTTFFMVLLGVISNGLLITYTQKFFTFMVTESRQGYVQTAIVKNLKSSFRLNTEDGIPLRSVLAWRKAFPGHVLHHIFINARFQYLSTFKEQASFLITGLVIIEMALNIHGHLCYELLQNLLYEQYDVALLIILGIFVVLKATEIGTDCWKYYETKRYANR